jgi:hypothetical protein
MVGKIWILGLFLIVSVLQIKLIASHFQILKWIKNRAFLCIPNEEIYEKAIGKQYKEPQNMVVN